jgi:hypothetical protein
MGTILISLASTTIIAIATLLVLLQAGIRQQERAGSIASRPPGLSAALARRIFGMHSDLPTRTRRSAPVASREGSDSSFAPGKNRPGAS